MGCNKAKQLIQKANLVTPIMEKGHFTRPDNKGNGSYIDYIISNTECLKLRTN